MRAIMRFSNMHREQVGIVRFGRQVLRVVSRGSGDTVELAQSYGLWTAEDGTPVEFEALFTSNAQDADTTLGRGRQVSAAGD
jgi:hypothetical protein